MRKDGTLTTRGRESLADDRARASAPSCRPSRGQ